MCIQFVLNRNKKRVLHLVGVTKRVSILCITFYNIKDPEIFRRIDTLAPNHNDQISQQCSVTAGLSSCPPSAR